MQSYHYYVGVDISNPDFCGSIYQTPDIPVKTIADVENKLPGFKKFEQWLNQNQVTPGNCVVCLEATGVYAEQLCYYFTAKGYAVALEPPLKVKRSFPDKRHKTDKVDSQEIAEYAYRFCDELRIWQPKNEIIEQIQVLLMTREQLVVHKTALLNTRQALTKKVVQTPLANKIYDQNIERLKKQIKDIENELKKLIDKHPDFRNTIQKLKSIPGVAMLMACNFLTVTNGFENEIATNYRKAAAFISICPYEHQSGTSVYKRPRSVKYGPARLRKLLHLAARSAITHNANFRKYYEIKKAQGKPRKLILNNVSNKILKIMCAIIISQRSYVDNYVSIHPNLLVINT